VDAPLLIDLIPSWTTSRLHELLTRGAAALNEETQQAIEDELTRRGEDVPPNPAISDLDERLQTWSDKELLAAYLVPVGAYDYRERYAIEAELARRQAESGQDLMGVPPASDATLPASLSAGMRAISLHTGSMIVRTFALGFLMFALLMGVGVFASSGGWGVVTVEMLIPPFFVANGALIVSCTYGLARDGLSLARGLPPGPRAADRPARRATWLIWGMLWLALLGCAIVLAAVSPWLLIPGAALWGLALASAVICQLLVLERGLTPLAALVALGSMLRGRPLHMLWLGAGWSMAWVLFFLLPMLIPICGACLGMLLALVLLPVTAGGLAQAYAALSGGFPPPGAPAPRWSFPGEPLPRWLLPMSSLLLTISLWALSGGAVFAVNVAQDLSVAYAGLFGWAPTAVFGGVAALPLLVTLGLLARARRIGGGVVLDETGLRVDVTDRWAGREIPWERVTGFRLSGAGVRFVLRRRPWSVWTGPLVRVRELEAHVLVTQLEAWNVRRDGA
jgi:hypothetical protein